jgi:hypothetical protein
MTAGSVWPSRHVDHVVAALRLPVLRFRETGPQEGSRTEACQATSATVSCLPMALPCYESVEMHITSPWVSKAGAGDAKS